MILHLPMLVPSISSSALLPRFYRLVYRIPRQRLLLLCLLKDYDSPSISSSSSYTSRLLVVTRVLELYKPLGGPGVVSQRLLKVMKGVPFILYNNVLVLKESAQPFAALTFLR